MICSLISCTNSLLLILTGHRTGCTQLSVKYKNLFRYDYNLRTQEVITCKLNFIAGACRLTSPLVLDLLFNFMVTVRVQLLLSLEEKEEEKKTVFAGLILL